MPSDGANVANGAKGVGAKGATVLKGRSDRHFPTIHRQVRKIAFEDRRRRRSRRWLRLGRGVTIVAPLYTQVFMGCPERRPRPALSVPHSKHVDAIDA